MQGMKFQRYETLGFTYWARGLNAPIEEAAPLGRLTLVQSVVQDLSGLVSGGIASMGGQKGPLDVLASLPAPHLQVRARSADAHPRSSGVASKAAH